MEKSLRDRIRGHEFTPPIEYPIAPAKPRLRPNHTAGDAKLYAELLINYEDDMVKYKQKKKAFRNVEHKLYELLKEECLKDCGIADHPKADKAWSMAWQKARSEGFEAVLYELEELAPLMEETIRQPEPFKMSEWKPVK
jgi:hypothetical protein